MTLQQLQWSHDYTLGYHENVYLENSQIVIKHNDINVKNQPKCHI